MNFWQKKSVKIWIIVGFAAIVAFVFLFRLGHDAFLDYDEAEYAKVAVQAVETNHYLTATLEGQLWFEKPPLQFWVGEIFFKTGLPVEWAFRLPSVLAGILTVVLVGLIIFEVSGSFYGALLGSLVLLTTGAFLMTSREFKLDVPVTMFIFLGLYAFVRGFKKPRWLLLIGISVGLAVMTKSIVGLLLFPILIAFALAFWNFKWLKDKWFWFGIFGGFVVALPWHIYEWLMFGNKFFYYYVIFNIFTRYQSNLLGNTVTAWTYLKIFQDMAMPWVLVFILAVVYLIVFWKKIDREIRPGILGAAISAIGLFLLFAVSKTKVIYYLTPIYPCLAIVVGLGLVDVFKKIKITWQKNVFVGVIFLLIVCGAIQTIPVGYHRDADYNIESQFANAEKKIGWFLAKQPIETIYFDSILYTENIRFYANKNVGVIDRNNLPARPFYVVLFWNKAHNDPFYVKLLGASGPVFQGPFEAVFFVK